MKSCFVQLCIASQISNILKSHKQQWNQTKLGAGSSTLAAQQLAAEDPMNRLSNMYLYSSVTSSKNNVCKNCLHLLTALGIELS